jgi:ribose 1,5-bisphosphate isomerase
MTNRRQKFLEELQKTNISEPNIKAVDDYLYHIVDEGTLGAGNHVKLVQDLFLFLCREVTEDNSWKLILIVKDFINETRGQEAPVIANSIHWLLRDLENESVEKIQAILTNRINEWNNKSEKRLNGLIKTGRQLLQNSSTIILFDYSSTVEAIIIDLCKSKKKSPEIIVFESRVIDGGWPYVKKLIDLNISVRYVLDSAMDLECSRADAVLLGVENLRCDGSLTNTIGSLAIARIAMEKEIKVYGCCDFFKLDLNTYNGVFKQPANKNFENLLLDHKKDSSGNPLGNKRSLIDTVCPELEVVPPQFLTGFITDIGFIEPEKIKKKGMEYFPEANTDDHE